MQNEEEKSGSSHRVEKIVEKKTGKEVLLSVLQSVHEGNRVDLRPPNLTAFDLCSKARSE